MCIAKTGKSNAKVKRNPRSHHSLSTSREMYKAHPITKPATSYLRLYRPLARVSSQRSRAHTISVDRREVIFCPLSTSDPARARCLRARHHRAAPPSCSSANKPLSVLVLGWSATGCPPYHAQRLLRAVSTGRDLRYSLDIDVDPAPGLVAEKPPAVATSGLVLGQQYVARTNREYASEASLELDRS